MRCSQFSIRKLDVVFDFDLVTVARQVQLQGVGDKMSLIPTKLCKDKEER